MLRFLSYVALLFRKEFRISILDKRSPILVITFYVLAGALFSMTFSFTGSDITDSNDYTYQIVVLWIILLFSLLIGFEDAFNHDCTSGWLEMCAQQNFDLAPLIMVRIIWKSLIFGISIIVCTPLLCFWLQIDFNLIPRILLGFVLSIPGLIALMHLVVALGMDNSSKGLFPILILPLWLPFLFISLVITTNDLYFGPALILSLTSLATCFAVPPLTNKVLISNAKY